MCLIEILNLLQHIPLDQKDSVNAHINYNSQPYYDFTHISRITISLKIQDQRHNAVEHEPSLVSRAFCLPSDRRVSTVHPLIYLEVVHRLLCWDKAEGQHIPASGHYQSPERSRDIEYRG